MHEDLEFNIKKYANFNKQVRNYFKYKNNNIQLNDVKLQTDYVMNSSIEKFEQLAPSIRVKRGILNPLGSIIKIITGNLDNEDAIRYENMIGNIKTQQDTLMKKVTLISEITESISKISNSTRKNFIQIDAELLEIKQLMNQTNSNLLIHNFINIYRLFLHHFQLLYIRWNEIESCLTFSKLGILHQSLINSEELLKLLKSIETSDKLVYPVNYDNLVKIEQCIKLKAYSKGSQITFVLDIPIIKNEEYIYYKAIPIPVTTPSFQTAIIIPKYPYLLVKGSEIVSLAQPCDELYEASFLCYENESQLPIEDKCITTLMKFSHNTSSCYPVPVEINSVKIQSIEKERWIIYSKAENILSKICNNEIINENIKGTYLLILDDHCDVKIGEAILKSRHATTSITKISKLPLINLPELTNPDQRLQRKPINLDNSDLVNLQQLNNLLKISESIVNDKYERVINVKNISIGTVLIYVILLIFICVFLIYKYNSILRKCHYQNNQSENNRPSDNFELMGGGVMQAVPERSVITTC